jgi:gliding motility-associated-like protein
MVKVYLFLLVLLFCFSKVSGQAIYCPPPNIGFEKGNFSGWQSDTGHIDMQGNINLISVKYAVNGRQTLYTAAISQKTDPFGGFPTRCPYGGNYSIRLGNSQVGGGAERVSYTFNVPEGANQYDLIFYYAVVLQNPAHEAFQQPRFTVKTFDVTDSTYVTCSSFDFIASSSLPGFKLAPISATDSAKYSDIYYKDWTPATINLIGYAGKQIRLEFTTNDCTEGGHFGYAYLDVNEDCGSPITGNTYCSSQSSETLTAPGGFGTYSWYNADFSQKLAGGQVLSLSPPPADGTKYAVVLTPFNGLGCTDTLYTTISRVDASILFKAVDTLYGCPGTGVNLTSTAVTAGSSPGLQLTYFTDKYALDYLYNPQQVLTSGTYYIKAVNTDGCIDIEPVTVIVGDPPLDITNPTGVVDPVTADISTTFTHFNNVNYSYYTDSTLTATMADYQHVGKTGNYYIVATNSAGCTTVKPVYVKIYPPLPPMISAPTAFTPNNDGVNDNFYLTVKGYCKFESMKIYNRYGQVIFETKSEDTAWDGRIKGTLAPPGTYYRVFNGLNVYHGTQLVQSGPITLLR